MARVRAIEEVCARHGVSIRQAALRFASFHPAVISVLLGAETAAEIKANVDDLETEVSNQLWADLKAASLLAADAPTP